MCTFVCLCTINTTQLQNSIVLEESSPYWANPGKNFDLNTPLVTSSRYWCIKLLMKTYRKLKYNIKLKYTAFLWTEISLKLNQFLHFKNYCFDATFVLLMMENVTHALKNVRISIRYLISCIFRRIFPKKSLILLIRTESKMQNYFLADISILNVLVSM